LGAAAPKPRLAIPPPSKLGGILATFRDMLWHNSSGSPTLGSAVVKPSYQIRTTENKLALSGLSFVLHSLVVAGIAALNFASRSGTQAKLMAIVLISLYLLLRHQDLVFLPDIRYLKRAIAAYAILLLHAVLSRGVDQSVVAFAGNTAMIVLGILYGSVINSQALAGIFFPLLVLIFVLPRFHPGFRYASDIFGGIYTGFVAFAVMLYGYVVKKKIVSLPPLIVVLLNQTRILYVMLLGLYAVTARIRKRYVVLGSIVIAVLYWLGYKMNLHLRVYEFHASGRLPYWQGLISLYLSGTASDMLMGRHDITTRQWLEYLAVRSVGSIHSEYLFILFDFGAIGLLLFLGFMLAVFRWANREGKTLLLTILMAALTDIPLSYSLFFLFPISLLIGYLKRLPYDGNKRYAHSGLANQ
jgi:hypothetical protein